MKTTKDAICGGYTSNYWDGSGKNLNDPDAFVFNLTQKFVTISKNTQFVSSRMNSASEMIHSKASATKLIKRMMGKVK